MNRETGKKVGLRGFSLLLAGAMVLAGCGSNEGPDVSGEAGGTSDLPLTIRMTLNFDGKEVPKKDNEVETAIEQYTNTSLELTHLSSNDFCTKLPVMLASGELPQVIASCGAPNQSYLISAARGGTFWDITTLIQDYPNLSSMPELVYENVSIDGKLYGIPRFRPISRFTYGYRQDWLENLGLNEPKTTEEFYNMLKAFTEDDPDQNGNKDTFGLSLIINNNSLSPDFGLIFGAPNNWGVVDGKFVKAEETDEYFEGLKFMKRLYDEGLINSDFATISMAENEGNFENGKAGLISMTTNNVLGFDARVKRADPNGRVDFFSGLERDGEKRLMAERGSNGILMFPKSSVKTEEELKQLLTFFDKLAEKEMADLLEWGIEGKHYEITEGKAVRTNQEAFDNEISFPYKYPLVTVPLTEIKTPGDLDPISQKVIEVEKDNEQYAVQDPSMVLLSDTWAEKGAELTQILTDAKVRFIMGRIDENGWRQEVAKFKNAGGDAVAEEYAEAAVQAQR